MEVKIADGQTDVTKPNLGDLQSLLDAAMESLIEAQMQEDAKHVVTREALLRVSKLQNQISDALLLLKRDAPDGSPWSAGVDRPSRSVAMS